MSIDPIAAFEIAGGTATGRAHVVAGRGSQDAHTWLVGPTALVAVVADGCGSGTHSEVGATLGARLVTRALSRRIEEGASIGDPGLWAALRDELLAALRPLVAPLGGSPADAVSDLFLFTIVGVAISAETGCVFAAGDGVFAVDGEVQTIGPFANNAPPYLGYGLLGGAPGPAFSVLRVFDPRSVRSVMIGTDGAADLEKLASRPLPGGGGEVGPLRQFWEDDRYFANRDLVRRRLALVNRASVKPIWAERRLEREGGLLEDDATLVVVRRRG